MDLNAPHQKYHLKDGREVVGVTTILKSYGGDKVNALLGWACKLEREGKKWRDELAASGRHGTLVHGRVAAAAHGQAPEFKGATEAEIDASFAPAQAIAKWLLASEWKIKHSELQMVSEAWEVGGTCDLIMEDQSGGLVLIDLKTSSSVHDTHAIQACAYASMYLETFEVPVRRIIIAKIGQKETEVSAHEIKPEKIGALADTFSDLVKFSKSLKSSCADMWL